MSSRQRGEVIDESMIHSVHTGDTVVVNATVEEKEDNIHLRPTTQGLPPKKQTNDNSKKTTKQQPERVVLTRRQSDNLSFRTKKHDFFWQLAYKSPVLYCLVVNVILPFLFLIFLSFVCGHFLSKIEAPHELEANNFYLSSRYELLHTIDGICKNTQDAPKKCLKEYDEKLSKRNSNHNNKKGEIYYNMTDLREHMESCGERYKLQAEDYLSNVSMALFMSDIDEASGVSFNWIRCYPNGTDSITDMHKVDHQNQWEYIERKWKESYEELYNQYVTEYQKSGQTIRSAEELAAERARMEATGTDTCMCHPAGGAWFWFTVMSTVGYGNTAPVTSSGRAFVFTFGFLSIVLFTCVIGNAAYISLIVFEDFAKHNRFRHITSGFVRRPLVSAIFWLFVFWLWVLFLAGYVSLLCNEPLSDMYWFSYISLTTVGLGDIHIPHEMVTYRFLFGMPVIMLCGFVFFSNFLIKLGAFVIQIFPTSGPILEDAIKKKRQRATERRLQQQYQQHEQQQQQETLNDYDDNESFVYDDD